MFSERLQARLEALNRAPLAPSSEPTAHDSSCALLPSLAQPHEPHSLRSAFSVSLRSDVSIDSLPGEEARTAWGPHWMLRRPLEEIWPQGRRFWHQATQLAVKERVAAEDLQSPGSDAPLTDVQAWCRSFPQRSVLLDLETCGLAGSVIFLVGVIHWVDRKLVLSQLWARNYAEEKAILQSLWSLLADCTVMATFNGKSFDWPQVQDRSTLHHLGYRRETDSPLPAVRPLSLIMPTETPGAGQCGGSPCELDAMQPGDVRPEPRHLDLLHHSRREWRSRLPNCKLQTLERYICGRHRVGDLPGSEIPQAYHDYVRTGDLRQVRAILHHNALDLITLLQLALAVFKSAPGPRVDG